MTMSNNNTRKINLSITKFMATYREWYTPGTLLTMTNRLMKSMHDLNHIGYGVTDIRKLKPKHIEALVALWKKKALSVGTLKNRMTYLRFVCEQTGRRNIIKDNPSYGIGKRIEFPKINRAIEQIDLEKISDPYLKASIRLQQAFGLRREECLKIIPTAADHGGYIQLKASWKSKWKTRTIRVQNPEQRNALDHAKAIAGKNKSLIPQDKSYICQRNAYDRAAKALGQTNLNGLRYAFAQRLYKTYTGWECPFNGGKNSRKMTEDEVATLIRTQGLN